jgi:hypothetical protein
MVGTEKNNAKATAGPSTSLRFAQDDKVSSISTDAVVRVESDAWSSR